MIVNNIELKPQPGPQETFLASIADIAIFGGAAGGGKLLDLNTPVPTPMGWATVGELSVNDTIFDEMGNECTILELYAIEQKPVSYRLTFDDKSSIDCCEDHLWLTYDAKELSQLTCKDEDWKARRRDNRPSRATGSQGEYKSKAIAERNSKLAKGTSLPIGTVRTTKEIINTLITPRGRRNHAVPVAKPLLCGHKELLIHPYVLGAWLGDGTAGSGGLTGIDPQIWEEIEKEGFPVTHHADVKNHNITGLVSKTKILGLYKNKHIPQEYMRASYEQRLSLLQGLMDTDGTVTKEGVCEFTNTNKRIIDGALELINSLGMKANYREGRATLYGKDCGPKYTIKWSANVYVFRLKRKRDKQVLATRRTTQFRYIVKAESIPSVPMRCIRVSSPSSLFLVGRQMVPTHNSYALLLDPLRYIDNPNFGAVIFRRTGPQITNEGGLWDVSEVLYNPLRAVSRIQQKDWKFPSGATITFSHMEHEKNRLDWQGSQVPMLGFDELTHFTLSQFLYMLSRNRSTCGITPYVRATCNPDSKSWVRKMIDWWIGEDGYAIKERSGIIRYFINFENVFHWADTPEELQEKFGYQIIPKSFTFISALLTDNKVLMSADPGYMSNLMALPLIEREQLLNGNWNINADGGIIRSDWIQYYDVLPEADIKYYTWSWDTAVKEGQKNDYSVGQLWARTHNAHYLVAQIRDKLAYPLLKKKVREMAGIFPAKRMLVEDKQSGQQLIQDLKAESILPVVAMMPGRNMGITKEERCNYVSSMFEAGKVFVPKLPWTADLVMEWCAFPNAPHDDQVDAMSQYLSYEMRALLQGYIPNAPPETTGQKMEDYDLYDHPNQFQDRYE